MINSKHIFAFFIISIILCVSSAHLRPEDIKPPPATPIANGKTENTNNAHTTTSIANGKTENTNKAPCPNSTTNGKTENTNNSPSTTFVAHGKTENTQSSSSSSFSANGRTESTHSSPSSTSVINGKIEHTNNPPSTTTVANGQTQSTNNPPSTISVVNGKIEQNNKTPSTNSVANGNAENTKNSQAATSVANGKTENTNNSSSTTSTAHGKVENTKNSEATAAIANGKTENTNNSPSSTSGGNGKIEHNNNSPPTTSPANGKVENTKNSHATTVVANGKTENTNNSPSATSVANGKTENTNNSPSMNSTVNGKIEHTNNPPSTTSAANTKTGSTNNSSSAASSTNNKTENTSNSASASASVSGSIKGNFAGSFSKVYAFGDSYTDTGNAELMGGLQSFMKNFFSLATSGSSSSLSGNRLSNGRLVIDFLTESLDIPHLAPYKQDSADFSSGCNFAAAGATALMSDFFTKGHEALHNLMWQGNPMSFQTQVDWFNNFVNERLCQGKNDADCKSEIENGLFWLGDMGGNDYERALGTSTSMKWLTEQTLTQISTLLKTLLEKGAKYVVVPGIPPIGCCPLGMFLTKSGDRDPMGCSGIANSAVVAHNDLVQKMIGRLREQFPQCTIVYADYFNAYKTIVSNLTKFNFADPFKTCCGAGGGLYNFNLDSLCGTPGASVCKDPNQFIHWDGIHFTEAMNKQLSNLIFQGGFCKPSFDELVKLKMGGKAATVATKGAMAGAAGAAGAVAMGAKAAIEHIDSVL